jgi:hypothetical protein
MSMKRFIPREKLGRKARKQLDSGQRATWAFSPVTKKVESKKLYNRKRKSHDRYDDYGMGFFILSIFFKLIYPFEPHTSLPPTEATADIEYSYIS